MHTPGLMYDTLRSGRATRTWRSLGAALLALLLAALPYAQAQQFTPYFQLGSPNPEPSGQFGQHIADVGDMNGDGTTDFIVNGYAEDPGASPTNAGRSYVYDGANGSLLYTLISPNEVPTGAFGISAAGIGDVNGDSLPDLLVGAPRESVGGTPNLDGRAYVFSGADGTLLYDLVSPNLNIGTKIGGFFGRWVDNAGDVNADGVNDILIAAINENVGSNQRAGRAYVFSGADGSLIHTLSSPNVQYYGNFGTGLSSIGDIDSDGVRDVLIGAPFENPGGSPFRAGRAYVFSGRTGALVHTLVSPNEDSNGYFGNSTAGLGDVDGDDVPDFVVAAVFEDPPGSPNDAGRAYVFSGADGSLIHTLVSPNEQAFSRFARDVAGIRDVNFDGISDVIVAANTEEPKGSKPDVGRAYVFSGDDGSVLLTLVSPKEQPSGNFGYAVSALSDLNGDDLDDIAIGAYFERFRYDRAGKAYVFVTVHADAGDDLTAECAGPDGTDVTLDGSGSSNQIKGFPTYTWTDTSGKVVGTGETPTLTLGVGTYAFTLTVRAKDGTTDSDAVTVTVEDTTAPVLTLATERLTLWPPNHTYATYTAADFGLTVTDACAGDLTADAVFGLVGSDEPEDVRGGGDGHTTDDIVLASDCGSVQLRAERQGGGNGRVYSLVFAATDASGNTGTATAYVEVPKSRNRTAVDDGIGAGYSVNGCASVAAPTAAATVAPTDALVAYPNPFNPHVQLRYTLAEAGEVDLRVYDVTGREVAVLARGPHEAGAHTVAFDGTHLASGVYVARLRADARTETLRLTLLK